MRENIPGIHIHEKDTEYWKTLFYINYQLISEMMDKKELAQFITHVHGK